MTCLSRSLETVLRCIARGGRSGGPIVRGMARANGLVSPAIDVREGRSTPSRPTFRSPADGPVALQPPLSATTGSAGPNAGNTVTRTSSQSNRRNDQRTFLTSRAYNEVDCPRLRQAVQRSDNTAVGEVDGRTICATLRVRKGRCFVASASASRGRGRRAHADRPTGDRYAITHQVGSEHLFDTVQAAVQAYQAQAGMPPGAKGQ